jgi:hypothetical protein
MTGSIPVRSTGKGTLVVIIPNAEKCLGFFVTDRFCSNANDAYFCTPKKMERW